MKATTRKRITITAVLTFGLASTLILTSFVAFKGRKLRRPMQNEKVIEYVKTNVLPVLKEKRENFDQYLSAEEKQKVAELQQRLLVLHTERIENFQRRPGQGRYRRGERPELSADEREQLQAHIKERRLIMTEAWTIADNHESEIESILEELKPDMENWREDIWSLRESYREERQKEREEWRGNRDQRRSEFQGKGPGGRSGRGFGGRGMGYGPGGGQGIMMQYASPPMFVLFDADKALNLLEDVESRAVTVFPNPTDGSATIKFELSNAEKVNIRVYDNQGNLIATVLDEIRNAGEHEVFVDVSNYDYGLYFYEIITGSTSQKGRLIKR
ncbi:T9SS type A sorting domain-containing protein [Bacteroidota bacterium]